MRAAVPRSRAAGADLQQVLDLRGFRDQGVVAPAQRRDIAFDAFEQALLGLAPAEAIDEGGAIDGELIGARERAKQRGECAAVGILRLARQFRIGDDARDGVLELFAPPSNSGIVLS